MPQHKPDQRVPEASGHVGETRGPSDGDAPCAQLLLVDDEKDFADALAFRLRARGFACQVAYRGEQALGWMDRPELEAVLLDLNMPGLHGLEALRRIKAARPDVEVLLLTGEADVSTAAKGMRRGAGDYLLKPVNFPQLLDSVHKARQRARERRDRLRAAQAGKLMALGALASGVGHEINNPLQLIMQGAEWLCELAEDARRFPPDVEAMRKTANMIRAQAGKAGTITAQLLELAHETRTNRACTVLPRLAERLCGQMRERASALGARITVDMREDLPPLPYSSAELEPVLAHLLRNALDGIEALNRGRGEVHVAADHTHGSVVISVRDNGEGIRAEHASRIFDPFFSTRPVGKGAGLGLTLCHSIITALRGNIRFVSPEDGGALFVVEIPVSQESAASQPGGLADEKDEFTDCG